MQFHKVNSKDAKYFEDAVLEYVRSMLEYSGLCVTIECTILSGSRCRGLEHSGSDVDVVVVYSGSEREDSVFNLLHERVLTLEGLVVDINPLREGETGTFEEYLTTVEQYLDEKRLSSFGSVVPGG